MIVGTKNNTDRVVHCLPSRGQSRHSVCRFRAGPLLAELSVPHGLTVAHPWLGIPIISTLFRAAVRISPLAEAAGVVRQARAALESSRSSALRSQWPKLAAAS